VQGGAELVGEARLLQHRDPVALLTEVDGGSEAANTGADHDHIEPFLDVGLDPVAIDGVRGHAIRSGSRHCVRVSLFVFCW
jgi:hypothetical protein